MYTSARVGVVSARMETRLVLALIGSGAATNRNPYVPASFQRSISHLPTSNLPHLQEICFNRSLYDAGALRELL